MGTVRPRPTLSWTSCRKQNGPNPARVSGGTVRTKAMPANSSVVTTVTPKSTKQYIRLWNGLLETFQRPVKKTWAAGEW